MFQPGLAWKPQLWLGLRQLWLSKPSGQAVGQSWGLAWAQSWLLVPKSQCSMDNILLVLKGLNTARDNCACSRSHSRGSCHVSLEFARYYSLQLVNCTGWGGPAGFTQVLVTGTGTGSEIFIRQKPVPVGSDTGFPPHWIQTPSQTSIDKLRFVSPLYHFLQQDTGKLLHVSKLMFYFY